MTKHTYVTHTDEIRCDFCSGPRPTTRYPCAATVALTAGPATIVSDDDWAACAACAAVVRTGDPIALARWVVAHPPGPEEALVAAIPDFRRFMLQKLVDLYTRLLPVLGDPTTDMGTANDGAVSIRVEEED